MAKEDLTGAFIREWLFCGSLLIGWRSATKFMS
jgi:hypothetical protein